MTDQPAANWGEFSLLHDTHVLSNFQARSTDVLITTAPKAGTTWMQQILFQLCCGGSADFNTIDDVVPWLELHRADKSWNQRLAEYEQIEDPRIFKTHCTYEQTPGVDIARIILTSRDPRDCCVSFYHHTMNLTDKAMEYFGFQRPRNFDEYFKQWIDFAGWYRNVKSWWPHKTKENVLWLRYEDMVKNLSAAMDEILLFLGWEISPAQKNLAVEYSQFDWMKKNSEKFEARFPSGESFFKPDRFIRKGKVGGFDSLLTPQHERVILQQAASWLPDDCLEFLNLKCQ